MSLSESAKTRIESYLESNNVVLFMKGTPDMPQCGFSATTAGILDSMLSDYQAVNVLADQEIREGIKIFGDWPTIPQLYIGKELVGGCDIVKDMFNSGELHDLLGMEKPDRTPPQITISDKAAEAIQNGLRNQSGATVHLAIDGRWQHHLTLQPSQPNEVKCTSNGIDVYMDVGSAQRARGLVIDWVESFQGSGLSIDNPNAPKPVSQLSAEELKSLQDQGIEHKLLDVRPENERSDGILPNDERYDTAAHANLDKETKIVFYCRSGARSNQVAEQFRLTGFSDVHNLAGGTVAWRERIGAL